MYKLRIFAIDGYVINLLIKVRILNFSGLHVC